MPSAALHEAAQHMLRPDNSFYWYPGNTRTDCPTWHCTCAALGVQRIVKFSMRLAARTGPNAFSSVCNEQAFWKCHLK